TTFEKAISTANGNAIASPTSIAPHRLPPACAAHGLRELRDQQATIPVAVQDWLPRLWQLVVTFALIVFGFYVLLALAGWALRGVHGCHVLRSVRLVPRIQIATFGDSKDAAGSAPSVTSMTQERITALQRSDGLRLDFNASDTRFDDLVAAIKDVDA